MKSLIRKIYNSNLVIKTRNSINVRPLNQYYNDLNNVSVSDSFLWRTDNNFTTKFKYSDILKLFFSNSNSNASFEFYDYNNKMLKKLDINFKNISDEIIIDKNFFNGLESYGKFYIFHNVDHKIDDDVIIANRCYLGFGKDKKFFSFIHGNAFSVARKIDKKKNYHIFNIIKKSFFQNQTYIIQKNFAEYDLTELFFSNPTNENIKFAINESDTCKLKPGRIIKKIFKNTELIKIKSNCLFLRPIVFSYKEKFFDVHHS